ncbi:MAG: hypothetical protein ACXWE1_02605, partial [Thermoanaerobaculia bacterium]
MAGVAVMMFFASILLHLFRLGPRKLEARDRGIGAVGDRAAFRTGEPAVFHPFRAGQTATAYPAAGRMDTSSSSCRDRNRSPVP